MEVFKTTMKQGIKRSKEFERKRLASYSANVGTKCGHGCTYCSSGASLRTHASFADAGRSPFASGYLEEAKAVESIRKRKAWSLYARNLIVNVQRSVRKYNDISRLRLLLYPRGLTAAHEKELREDSEGIIWLDKEKKQPKGGSK